MRQSGLMAIIILVSGVLLAGSTASADPGWRHDRDRKYDGHDWNNSRHRYNNHFRDRDYDRNRTRIDVRIGYDVYRYPRYVRYPSSYSRWDQGYRPYYYRDHTLVIYPDRSWERAPAEKIYWIEDNNQVALPQQTSQQSEERYCREYTADADVQGRTQQIYGTACMQPDGSWRIID